MSRLETVASIEDLRKIARQRMPRFAFDFIDGGAESEIGLKRNSHDFEQLRLLPRYLVDVSTIDTRIELLGREYAIPLGIAPVGFFNMSWPGADLMVARLAAEKQMPYVISAAASTPLETLAEAADGYAWFQIYIANDDKLTNHLVSRAKSAGIDVLVVTVDVAQPGKRDRDIRNGLRIPFRLNAGILRDLLSRPSWTIGTLTAGAPALANFDGPFAGEFGSLAIAEMQEKLISIRLGWEDLKRLRDRWKGSLVLKGLQSATDVSNAVDVGCDGIIVSNHGGRQADYAPSSISVLANLVEASQSRLSVMLDSGVRRGADIVRAKALGAEAVFSGRCFAYGAAAAGDAGCRKTLEILETELRRTLGQIGRPRFSDVDGAVLAS